MGSLNFVFTGNESFIHGQGFWPVAIVLLLLINLSGPIEVTAAARRIYLSFGGRGAGWASHSTDIRLLKVKNLTGFQLVKKFPAFYGIRKFITAFTNANQLSLI